MPPKPPSTTILALLRGREAVCQFWHSFLIGRALQRNDVHSLHVDIIWDTEQLQAFVQVRQQRVCCQAAGWVPKAQTLLAAVLQSFLTPAVPPAA